MVYGPAGPMRRRWPIGSAWPNLLLASDSLIRATSGAPGLVVLVERAAAPERDVQRLDIARAHGIAERAVRLGGPSRGRLERRAVLVAIAAQRQLAREGGSRDAGHAPHRLERVLEEPKRGGILVESVTDGLHLHGEQPRRIEAGGNREQTLKAPQQQSRAHEQHERQRDFRDDERAASAPVPAAGGPGALLEIPGVIVARRLQLPGSGRRPARSAW